MVRHPRWHLAAFVMLGWTSLANSGEPVDVDAAWVAKAKAGIKPLLDKYEPMAKRLDEEREIEYKQKGARPKPKNLIVHLPPNREHIVRLGDNAYSEQRHSGKGQEEQTTVQCQNSEYTFRLFKGKNSGDYALADYNPGKQERPLTDQLFSVHGNMFTHLAGILSTLEKSPNKLTKVRFDDATGMLDVSYKYPEYDLDTQFQLDPAKGWRLVEHRMETKSAIFTNKWAYGTTVSGVCFPSEVRATGTYKVAEAPPDFERSDRIISIKLTDKTEADFRMSAFGLKEPMGMAPVNRGSLLWLWISLAAIASIGIAAISRKLKGRALNVLGYAVLVAALLGWSVAGYLYFFRDEPGAVVNDPDRKIPTLALGTSEVQFRLHNPTRHDVRVIGYQFC